MMCKEANFEEDMHVRLSSRAAADDGWLMADSTCRLYFSQCTVCISVVSPVHIISSYI